MVAHAIRRHGYASICLYGRGEFQIDTQESDFLRSCHEERLNAFYKAIPKKHDGRISRL